MRTLPTICQKIIDQSHRWYKPTYPVVPWSYFFEKVKEIAGKQIKDIDKLIEAETVQTAAAYLHDMGEVSCCFLKDKSLDILKLCF